MALKKSSGIVCNYMGYIGILEVPEKEVEGKGQKVLYTTDSVQIRITAGSANASIVAILKNEILTSDLTNEPVQAADSNGNIVDWIEVCYFNNKDEKIQIHGYG